MAYDFVSASSQYIEGAAAAVTDEPVTFSALVYPKQTNAFNCIVSLGTTAQSHRFTIVASNTSVVEVATLSSQTGVAASGSTYSANIWQQMGGKATSDTSRQAFLDGAGGTVNTTSSNVTETLARTVIGARMSSTYGLFANALIAEVGIWNAALTDGEIASLGKGFKPTRIRPQSLVFYAPLIRNLQDTKGAMALTNNNAATVAAHPRVI